MVATRISQRLFRIISTEVSLQISPKMSAEEFLGVFPGIYSRPGVPTEVLSGVF